MHGFQLWVNLPAHDKLIAPRYQEIPSERLPTAATADGRARVRVIAGEALSVRAAIETRTPIVYLDWTLEPGASVEQAMPRSHQAFAYVFAGEALVGTASSRVRDGQLALLDEGDVVRLSVDASATAPARLLLLGGVPLREPIARMGPFVMNTPDEIRQAIRDYQLGRMGQIVR
jgi:hypothetical protein